MDGYIYIVVLTKIMLLPCFFYLFEYYKEGDRGGQREKQNAAPAAADPSWPQGSSPWLVSSSSSSNTRRRPRGETAREKTQNGGRRRTHREGDRGRRKRKGKKGFFTLVQHQHQHPLPAKEKAFSSVSRSFCLLHSDRELIDDSSASAARTSFICDGTMDMMCREELYVHKLYI